METNRVLMGAAIKGQTDTESYVLQIMAKDHLAAVNQCYIWL